jgi:hypothetical protein
MKKALIAVVVVVGIAIFLIAGLLVVNQTIHKKAPDTYVGITYCGNTVEDGKALIDKVKGYTNLFVLNSGLLQRDFDSVNELGDYAVDAGMYFIPYFGNYIQATFSVWLENAKERWGDQLLGVYYSDEPAGKMLDDYVQYKDSLTGNQITKTRYGDIFVEQQDGVQINYEIEGPIRLYEPSSDGNANFEKIFYPNGTTKVVNTAPNGFSYGSYVELQTVKPFKDNDDAFQRFIDRDKSNIEFISSKTRVYTTDYDLYWFDYLAGYDVIWSQVGWNLSYSQQIAQIRGAGEVLNKDWGVIITWKYQNPPYFTTSAEILDQMKTAYDCGADYIVVFNYYDKSSSKYGTMQEEHFKAVETFWKDSVTNANVVKGSIQADSALVFPHNYAWGGRWRDDNVWGIFKADERTWRMWDIMQSALDQHGFNLDIVYDDVNYPLSSKYLNNYYCSELD